MDKRDYEQKKVTIGNVEYTFQRMPVRAAMKMRQKWVLGNGLIDDIKMCDEVFKNIVVEPSVNLDDFDSAEAAMDVVIEAVQYQYGKREEKNE